MAGCDRCGKSRDVVCNVSTSLELIEIAPGDSKSEPTFSGHWCGECLAEMDEFGELPEDIGAVNVTLYGANGDEYECRITAQEIHLFYSLGEYEGYRLSVCVQGRMTGYLLEAVWRFWVAANGSPNLPNLPPTASDGYASKLACTEAMLRAVEDQKRVIDALNAAKE